MSALIFIDRYRGYLARYEVGGELRRTHHYSAPEDYERPVSFDGAEVERFRTDPPSEYYCGPLAPFPSGGKPGGTPAAARAA